MKILNYFHKIIKLLFPTYPSPKKNLYNWQHVGHSKVEKTFREDLSTAYRYARKTFSAFRFALGDNMVYFIYLQIKTKIKSGKDEFDAYALKAKSENVVNYDDNVDSEFDRGNNTTSPLPTATEENPFPQISSRVSKIEFGLAFFFAIYIYIFIVFQAMPSTVYFSREGFSGFIVMELIMFIYLFLCFLSFFGFMKKYRKRAALVHKIQKLFLTNIISIFVAYGFIIVLNYIAYTWPFSCVTLTRTFYTAGMNFHSQDYAMLVIKPFYIFLAILALHMLGKYLLRSKITFQHFVLVVLIIGTGLFVLGMSNIFYILLLLDTISLATVTVISLGATPGFTSANRYAFHYFLYSVLTSITAYSGSFLMYTCTNTFDVNVMVFMSTIKELSFVFENPAFIIGAAMILLKFIFFFGLFPFQQYVLEAAPFLTFGFLFFFTVVSKLPILVSFLTFLKVLGLNFECFRYFILLAGLVSILYSVGYIATCSRIKQFLALSSINQMGFVFTLMYFDDFLSIYVGILFYFIYAVACAALYLFLSSIRSYVRGDESDGDIDTGVDLRRAMADSYYIAYLHNQNKLDRDNPAQYFYMAVFSISITVITLAGIPPLGGFYLKLAFIEVFLVHGLYKSMALILFTTIISTYAYFNVLMLMKTEFDREDLRARNRYGTHVFVGSSFDFFIYLFLMLLTLLSAVLIAQSDWFWGFIDLTVSFFFDNHFYLQNAAESAYYSKYAALGVFGSNNKMKAFFNFIKTNFGSLMENKKMSFKGLLLICKAAAQRYWLYFQWSWRSNYIEFCKRNDRLWDYIAEVVLFLYYNLYPAFRGMFTSLLPKDDSEEEKIFYTKFVSGSYAVEFLIFSVGLVIFFFGGVELGGYHTDYVKYNLLGFACVHLVIVHLLSYAFVYSITYSVSAYRFVVAAYGWLSFSHQAETFEFGFNYVYRNAYFPIGDGYSDLYIFFYHRLLGINFYYVVIGFGTFGIFAVILAAGAYNNYSITFGKMRGNKMFYNSLLLRRGVRLSFTQFALEWFVRHGPKVASFLILFAAFGPFLDCYNSINHDLVFGVLAIYKSAKFFTINFMVPVAIFWGAVMNFLYCSFKGIRSYDELVNHINAITVPIKEGRNEPEKAAQFVFYIFFVIGLPLSGAAGWSGSEVFFTIYVNYFIYACQEALVYIGAIGFCLIFTFGIVRQENSGQLFLNSIFYYSLTIIGFFVNLIIGYRFDASCSPDVASADDGREVLTRLVFGPYSITDLVSLKTEMLSFGYDYFTLLLCTMTAVIFSFVYLISIYNPNLHDKKLFFILLAMIEILTLMAFLSANVLGFVVYFESTLLPMALLVGYGGSSDKRGVAAKQFFFYSLIFSLPAMAAVVLLYDRFGTLNYEFLLKNICQLSAPEQTFVGVSLFLMFAVKIPIFPFHSGLLNAHVEAPTGGSIVLAAIMLKLGAFGMIRYLFGLLPQLSAAYSLHVCALAIASIIFSSLSSLVELDAKKLVAQTSISHMNYVILGLFALDARGFYGALFLIIGHGIISTGLFYLVGILYDRFHTRQLDSLGGLVHLMPLYSVALFFFVMANAGFPGSLSFIGELYILMGVARQFSSFIYLVLILAATALLFSNVRLFITICYGTLNKNLISNATSDLTHLELYCALWLAANAFLLMGGNDIIFSGLYHDAMIRYIIDMRFIK